MEKILGVPPVLGLHPPFSVLFAVALLHSDVVMVCGRREINLSERWCKVVPYITLDTGISFRLFRFDFVLRK